MNKKLTCYIIDDEYLAQEMLEEYISKVSFLELKGTFLSPLEAAAAIENDKPDLLFLDINMPDLDGLSFIPMLNPRPLIILTTAYDKFAIKAFELEVKDYLLKPYTFERFYKSVRKIFSEHGTKASSAADPALLPLQEHAYIFIKVGHRIQKIATADILFAEGTRDYLSIHTTEEKFMTLLNFAKLMELLPAHGFVRVHRSFLIAIDKIDHIEKNRVRIGKHLIPVSQTHAEAFYKMLNGNF